MQQKPIMSQKSLSKLLDRMTSHVNQNKESLVKAIGNVEAVLNAFARESFDAEISIDVHGDCGGDDEPSGNTHWSLDVSVGWDVSYIADYSFEKLLDECRECFDFLINLKPEFFKIDWVRINLQATLAYHSEITPDNDSIDTKVMWK